MMKTKFTFIMLACILIIGCTRTIRQKETNVSPTGSISPSPDATLVCSDTLGTNIRMKIIQGNYTEKNKEVFAIVLNPQHIPLSYGRHWKLEKWENNQWVIPKTKKEMFVLDDEMLPVTPPVYYCFSFPIDYYEITPGKYRISKSFWRNTWEVKLKAEFEIR